jgi:hypothetical protein
MGRVSDKAAGWYPDPDGENRQRYWDGDSWTEYFTPIAPRQAELHGSSTASADYPYLVASRSGPHPDLMAPPVPVGSTRGWPAAPAQAGDGETQEFSGGGKRSRASVWALIAASVLVVMLVVGVGWWAFGPEGTPVDDPTGAGTTQPTDGGETVTAELDLGTSTSATVPQAGLWVGMLTLDADATILVDARGERREDDLRIAIVPEGGGDPVAANDDRDATLAMGGSGLDPLAAATLTAGTYEVRVDERNSAEVTFDIAATEVTDALTSGDTVDVQAAEDGFWAGSLTVTGAGATAIDVTAVPTSDNDEPDAVILVIGNGDREYINDDRDADSRDPLLEQDLAAGTWVVLVFDYHGRSLVAEVTATTP